MRNVITLALGLLLSTSGAAFAQCCNEKQAKVSDKAVDKVEGAKTACGPKDCDSKAKAGCDKAGEKASKAGCDKAKAGCDQAGEKAACDKAGAKAACDKGEKAGCDKGEKAGCDKAKAGCDQQVAVSVRYGKLLAAAKKGCKTSKERLAGVTKVMGAHCADMAAKDIANLEAAVAKGCAKSKEKLALIDKALRPQDVALSAKIQHWTVGAGKGCEKSKLMLAAVKKASGVECPKAALAAVTQLEQNAAKGCAKSKEKLAAMNASLKQAVGSVKASDKKGDAKKDCGGCEKGKAEKKVEQKPADEKVWY